MAARFVKAPAGNLAFIGETKGFPQREAEGLRPPPDPLEKPPPRGFAKRGAVPVPSGDFEVSDRLVVFEK